MNLNPYPSLRNAHWARAAPRLFRFDRLGSGSPNDHVTWGTANTRRVLSCDVNGDGDDEPVFYAGNIFHISRSVTNTRVRAILAYGTTGDRALCGDWDGNGTDTPGVRRGSQFLLPTRGSTARPDRVRVRQDDRQGIVGDWNGDGVDTLAFSGQRLLLARLVGGAALQYPFGTFERPRYRRLDGNATDTPALRRGSENIFRNRTGVARPSFRYRGGQLTDAALIGHWSPQNQRDTISFWRR